MRPYERAWPNASAFEHKAVPKSRFPVIIFFHAQGNMRWDQVLNQGKKCNNFAFGEP